MKPNDGAQTLHQVQCATLLRPAPDETGFHSFYGEDHDQFQKQMKIPYLINTFNMSFIHSNKPTFIAQ